MLPLPYVQFEAEKGGMLLHESPLHNEKLQQDIDLEGKDGLNALCFTGLPSTRFPWGQMKLCISKRS